MKTVSENAHFSKRSPEWKCFKTPVFRNRVDIKKFYNKDVTVSDLARNKNVSLPSRIL